MAQRGKKYSGDLFARKWGTTDGFFQIFLSHLSGDEASRDRQAL